MGTNFHGSREFEVPHLSSRRRIMNWSCRHSDCEECNSRHTRGRWCRRMTYRIISSDTVTAPVMLGFHVSELEVVHGLSDFSIPPARTHFFSEHPTPKIPVGFSSCSISDHCTRKGHRSRHFLCNFHKFCLGLGLWVAISYDVFLAWMRGCGRCYKDQT